MLFGDAACNPHAASSISFYFQFLHVVWRRGMQPTCCVVYFFLFSIPPCCLVTRRATHTLCHLFIFIFISSMLFDDAVCNPHAPLSIYFYFHFLHVVWRHGVQPTCRVVYLFPPCCLTTRCATHMPCRLFIFIFISSMLFGNAACNPHTALSIYFYFYFCHVVWSLNVHI